MKIKWNGHASFTITSNDGTVLVTDPYDPGGYGGVLKYDTVRDKADGVIISHDHADHNYAEGLPGSPRILRGAGDINDIRIKAIETYHDESEGSERGPNVMFVFTVDGTTICFMGDLGHQLSKEQIDAVGPVDLLQVPVGGTYTVDADGAAELVEALGPRLVMPMHFKTDKCDLPISDAEAFLSLMSNVKRFEENEVDLSYNNLPSNGPEIWVLNHAC